VLSAPRSPWQRAYIERVIGTIRRECLDHVIVFNESSLYRHLQAFCGYYHRTRTHLACRKTARNRVVSNHQKPAGSSRSQRLAAFTIDTSAALPEQDYPSGRIAGFGASIHHDVHTPRS
jgi:transposase InsO family protein